METAKGKAMLEARLAKKLSQEVLSRGLCDRSIISRIEHGKYDPPDDLWQKLAERLNLPVVYPGFAKEQSREPRRSHTAMKEIHASLSKHQCEEAVRLATTTFWCLIEAGDADVGVNFGMELLKIFNKTSVRLGSDWIATITALLLHQVHRRAYHDIFTLGIILQRLNGEEHRYDDVLTMGHTLLSFKPPTSVRLELLLGIGTAHLRKQQLSDALFTFTQVLEETETVHSTLSYARALHGLSAVHLILHDWGPARRFSEQASIRYQDNVHEFYWLARQNWANAILHESGENLSALNVLYECAAHWKEQQRHQEFLSVGEDLFVWSREYQRTPSEIGF